MTTWQAEGNIIRGDNGTHIAEATDIDTARQIVREHSAVGDLVELARILRDKAGGSCNATNAKCIDAVLARAEGRE